MSHCNEKIEDWVLKLSWKLSFNHQIMAVKNAWGNYCKLKYK